MILETRFSEKTRTYTGSELRPHFLLTELGVRGSGVGAWIGPCDVKTEHLVDWEDRLEGEHIAAKEMVHFIAEFFGAGLKEGVLFQRLVIASMAEGLLHSFKKNKASARVHSVIRSGNDLFVDERKLSVSIVTASPVSVLMHLGVNIDPTGAPVSAIGLKELEIPPHAWALEILARISEEWQGITWACSKVRPVI